MTKLTPAPARRQQAHKANRTACVVDYLTEHGPTKRAAAITGITTLYQERHASKKAGRETIQLAMVEHLNAMQLEGKLKRGPRPEQILELVAE